MCLIAIAWRIQPDYPLIVIANRDEYHDRGARPMCEWQSRPGLFAGRDLLAGGAWLGATRGGRFASVTNYREGERTPAGIRSRGELVVSSLSAPYALSEYLHGLQTRGAHYSGFNLIAGDGDELFWCSNRAKGYAALEPGIYGLSNGLLNSAWPKVIQIRSALTAALARAELETDQLMDLLASTEPAADGDLPDTGVGMGMERWLSSIFILGERYGTRASSVYLRGADQIARLHERRFDDRGQQIGEGRFRFRLHPPRQPVN